MATTVARSIGNIVGNVFDAGTASGTAGTAIVTFSGTVPYNMSEGDKLTLDIAGVAEVVYVLSRDSASQITAQTNLVNTHSAVTFKDERAYSDATSWEAGQSGDLTLATGNDTIQKGVCYKDVTDFTDRVLISGSTTDSTHFMWLTTEFRQRHNGTAGVGVTFNPSVNSHAFELDDDFTLVEWIEVTGWTGNSSEAFRVRGDNCTISHVVAHDGTALNSDGVYIGANNITLNVENSIFYDIERTSIMIQSFQNVTVNVRNVTVHNCAITTSDNTPALGYDRNVSRDNTGSIMNLFNVYVHEAGGDRAIAIGTNPGKEGAFGGDFVITEDDTADDDFNGFTFPNNKINKSEANQFVNVGVGTEDFHLKEGADCIGFAADLGTTANFDIDNFDRDAEGVTWDCGADQFYRSTKSILLDGANERVQMGDVHNFERTDPFSLSIWFKTTDTGSAMRIMGNRKFSGTRRGYSIRIRPNQTKFLCFLTSTDNTNEAQVSFAWGATTFNDGNWHHAVMTYDGSSTAAGIKCYGDNVSLTPTVDSDNLSATIVDTEDFTIGNENSRFLDGNVDEGTVWKRELSVSEVNKVYNGGCPNDPNGHSAKVDLLSWWPLGENDTFPTATDKISGGFDGTYTNMEVGDIVDDVPCPPPPAPAIPAISAVIGTTFNDSFNTTFNQPFN